VVEASTSYSSITSRDRKIETIANKLPLVDTVLGESMAESIAAFIYFKVVAAKKKMKLQKT
jgi:hypothetical protein